MMRGISLTLLLFILTCRARNSIAEKRHNELKGRHIPPIQNILELTPDEKILQELYALIGDVPDKCSGRKSKNADFECEKILQPDVKELTLMFPEIKIPPVPTTYYYMIFDLADYGIDPNLDYNIIATRHHTNSDLLHHLLMNSCGKDDITPDTPVPMNDRAVPIGYCQMSIGAWSKDSDVSADDCYDDDYGVAFGKSGFMKIYLQLHYNNQDRCENLWDTAGVTFYYTQTMRPKNVGTLILAADHFTIPPKQESYTITGTCYSECTSVYTSPFTIIKTVGHMHQYGINIHVEQRRNNSVIAVFGKEDPYVYDDVHIQHLDEPAVVHPGDELRVVCKYSTMEQTNYITWGKGTDLNEMCTVYLVVYPAQAIKNNPICSEPFFCHLYPFYTGLKKRTTPHPRLDYVPPPPVRNYGLIKKRSSPVPTYGLRRKRSLKNVPPPPVRYYGLIKKRSSPVPTYGLRRKRSFKNVPPPPVRNYGLIKKRSSPVPTYGQRRKRSFKNVSPPPVRYYG